MNRFALLAFIVVLLITGDCFSQQKAAAKRPNIIFIVADDLGYGNLSCYNATSKVKTPNIDRLAKEGMRFTRFYSGSTVCAPSRCALMTGKDMGHAFIRGNGREALRPQDTTIAERLQRAGYVTGMFGKWGLGEEGSTGTPEKKGFNAFFGYLNQTHAHNYYTDYLYEIKDRSTTKVSVDSNRYSQVLIMEKAISFLEDNRNNPFFLYLPFTIPHAELKLPDTLMQPFMNADGSSKFEPETVFPGRGQYDKQEKPRAAFAAMITRLDNDIARILDAVKRLGIDEYTYIFFTSDNGPHKEGGGDPEYFNSSGPLRGIKRDLYEGGIRVPMLVRAPGRVTAGKISDMPWAFWDILPTITSLVKVHTPSGIDGISFLPALSGQKQKQHAYLYWQFNEGGLKEAIIKDDWKLLRFKSAGKPEILELYNLKADVSEINNMAASNAVIVNRLRALMLKAKTPPENKLFDWTAVEN